MSSVTMVDASRQWFKAEIGMASREGPRDVSFCSKAIQCHDLFVVEDAAHDDRFADNPLVTDGQKIRFYAGMPLVTKSGYEAEKSQGLPGTAADRVCDGEAEAACSIRHDDFKLRNDTWGHAAGDEVLRRIGAILGSTVRVAGVAARYGGEEFAVLLPETSAENVMVFAERLKANIAAADWECGQVTVSFGVATLSMEMISGDDLVEAADRGLYAAKRAGKDRILVGV